MDIRLLGPVEAFDGCERIALGTRRQRCVLAVLAMTPGQAVAAEKIIDRVWGEQLPQDVRGLLYTHISRVRSALTRSSSQGEPPVLRRTAGGYVLDIAPDHIDLHRARQLASQARAVVHESQDGGHRAAELLRRACDLWQGIALAGLTGDWADRTREFLDDERLNLVTERFEAELRLDRHLAVIGPLSELVAKHPLNETLAGLLMLALYRSGRRADALKLYSRTRHCLVEEIGDEPGTDLQRLHELILNQGRELGDATTVTSVATEVADPQGHSASGAGGPPAQLPPGVSTFRGRQRQLQQLSTLPRTDGAGRPSSIGIVVISGLPGVGKTALALHWAHQVRDQFPDGQLYVDLRGHSASTPLAPIQPLAGFLRAFGVAPEKVPSEAAEASAVFRTLLADKRVLVVLDNAADADQVRPLLPASNTSVALVTSRNRLGGLVARDGAQTIVLDVLTSQESVALLNDLLGADRVERDREAVGELASLCDHLPLALRIAAANIIMHPQESVTDFVRRIRQDGRLGALAVAGDDQVAVRAAFDLSYRYLSPPERRQFRLLGIAPGPDIDSAAAARLTDVSSDQATQLLRNLAHTHLVQELPGSRYALHDLLREYAAGRADTEETAAARSQALLRLYDHYLHASGAAATAAFPQAIRLPAAAPLPSPGPHFDEPADALRWLDAERANLVAAVSSAADHGYHRHAWGIADNVRAYFWTQMHVPEWSATTRAGLSAAEAAGDLRAQAACYLSLAGLSWRQSRYREAAEHGQTALSLAQRTGWSESQDAMLSQLGIAHARLGDSTRAVDYLRQALTLCEQAGDLGGQAAALLNLSSMYLELGQISLTREYAERALRHCIEVGTPDGQGLSLDNLGTAHYLAGRFEAARQDLGRASAIYGQIGKSSGTCSVSNHLAEVHIASGEFARAAELSMQAARLAHEKGHTDLEADALTNLSATRLGQGRTEEACQLANQATAVAERANSLPCRLRAQLGLAAAQLCTDDGGVDERLGRVLAAAEQAGYQLIEAQVRTMLAELHLAKQSAAAARAEAERALVLHREAGHRRGEAHTLLVLARALAATGGAGQAAACRRRGRRMLAALGLPG